MVQAVENWAHVQGQVTKIEPHPQLPDYVVAQIDVHDVAPVAGFPNLFDWARGQNIQLAIPADKASQLAVAEGASIRSDIRHAGPGRAFVNPDTLQIV
jgi:hypothetical protein